MFKIARDLSFHEEYFHQKRTYCTKDSDTSVFNAVRLEVLAPANMNWRYHRYHQNTRLLYAFRAVCFNLQRYSSFYSHIIKYWDILFLNMHICNEWFIDINCPFQQRGAMVGSPEALATWFHLWQCFICTGQSSQNYSSLQTGTRFGCSLESACNRIIIAHSL